MRILLALTVLVLAAPPKAKAPKKKPATPALKPVVVVAPAVGVLEIIDRPSVDYQAEVYSGVPLDDPYAKARGLDKGLVRMVFERQRRLAFRVAHEKLKKIVRFAGEGPRDHVDVVETHDGFVVVDTTTSNAGIFTSSDVYVFAKNTTSEQRVAMVTREHVRRAMAAYASR